MRLAPKTSKVGVFHRASKSASVAFSWGCGFVNRRRSRLIFSGKDLSRGPLKPIQYQGWTTSPLHDNSTSKTQLMLFFDQNPILVTSEITARDNLSTA